MSFFTWIGVAVVFLIVFAVIPRVTSVVLLVVILKFMGYFPPGGADYQPNHEMTLWFITMMGALGFFMDAIADVALIKKIKKRN